LLRSRASGFYLTLAPSFCRSFLRRDDAHPALTLFKVVIMTLVLLTAGVASIAQAAARSSPISLFDEGKGPLLCRLAGRANA
jgi:hypothetical protein